jgi:hypothetical protein
LLWKSPSFCSVFETDLYDLARFFFFRRGCEATVGDMVAGDMDNPESMDMRRSESFKLPSMSSYR